MSDIVEYIESRIDVWDAEVERFKDNMKHATTADRHDAASLRHDYASAFLSELRRIKDKLEDDDEFTS